MHTCKRKSKDTLLPGLVVPPFTIRVVFEVDVQALPVKRSYCDCASDVGAQDGHQEKLPLWLDTRLRRQIGAQMSFRQQVREERRDPSADGAKRSDQSARLPLERQTQGRTVCVIDVVLLEGEQMALASQPVDDADTPSMQIHR